ncbi:MAG: putative rane protein [Thermoanaerobaculia bacterium]|nr:putative rane protein [Thermoanaerobaculia bacterium]
MFSIACSRSQSNGKPQDPSVATRAFLTWALQTSQSDSDLGAIAARRAYVPDTRTLAAQIARDHAALHADLVAIAQQHGITAPRDLEERHRALKENLLTLPGQVFDRGFTLAMAQDSTFMLRGFDRTSSDPALKQLAAKYRPLIEQQKKVSTQILDRIGGSPFGYAPDAGAPPPF